jgi:hypothetical protein
MEGIYRVPGRQSRLEALRDSYDKGNSRERRKEKKKKKKKRKKKKKKGRRRRRRSPTNQTDLCLGKPIEFEAKMEDPFTCADLLLLYLRSLPEPLVPQPMAGDLESLGLSHWSFFLVFRCLHFFLDLIFFEF